MSPDIFFSEKEGRSFDVTEGAEINTEESSPGGFAACRCRKVLCKKKIKK